MRIDFVLNPTIIFHAESYNVFVKGNNRKFKNLQ